MRGYAREGFEMFLMFGKGGYVILTLRDPPRPGPAHPREHGDSAAPKSLDLKQ